MPSSGKHFRIFPDSDCPSSMENGGSAAFCKSGTARQTEPVIDQDSGLTSVELVGSEKSIIFRSTKMRRVIAMAKKIARSNAAVLITGESGTGKELISRLIHQESARSHHHYVAINCAAMPESLAESLFFGHERGSFTGAFQGRIGQFQYAHQGSILLDEISEIPLTMQAKLLRVLEEQEVLKIGSLEPERIDVRIIATSNRNLQLAIKHSEFRGDLYYRLGTLKITIPPLRERPEDIEVLIEHFLNRFGKAGSISVTGITRETKARLLSHAWPGNVRELRNVIHSACVMTETPVIQCDTALDLMQMHPIGESGNPLTPPKRLDEIEKAAIIDCLNRHSWNKTAAAEELGVTARTLSNKLKLYQQHPTQNLAVDIA